MRIGKQSALLTDTQRGAAAGPRRRRGRRTVAVMCGRYATTRTDTDLSILFDAVKTEPGLMTLFAEYNKYLLRRMSVWLDL